MQNKSVGEEKPLPKRMSRAKKFSPADQVQHVVIRVRSDEGNTIAAHKKVIDKSGRVLFGKIGKSLGSAFIEQLNSQINLGVTTYCFVATYEGWNLPFGIYQCKLIGIHTDLKEVQKDFIPKYIQPIINGINTWLELETIQRVAPDEIKRIYVLSSGREVSGAMRGTTAVFRVAVKGDVAMKIVPDPTLKTKNQSNSLSTEFDDELGEDDNYDLREFEHYQR